MEKGCFRLGVRTSDREKIGGIKGIARPTKNQLIRHGREEKWRADHIRALDQCPQKEGVCPHVSTRTPKKPNSSLHKIARVQLSNKHDIFAHIPCEGHNSQEHSKVLIRGGRVKDLPGVKSHCIQGVRDWEFRIEEEADQNMVRKKKKRYEWKMPPELLFLGQ